MGDAFSKDGEGTKILEKIPGVGLGVAAVQAAHGNHKEAERGAIMGAVTLSTAALGFGAGAVIGGMGGAIVGSAIGTGGEFAATSAANANK
jgi:hypothetical protein